MRPAARRKTHCLQATSRRSSRLRAMLRPRARMLGAPCVERLLGCAPVTTHVRQPPLVAHLCARGPGGDAVRLPGGGSRAGLRRQVQASTARQPHDLEGVCVPGTLAVVPLVPATRHAGCRDAGCSFVAVPAAWNAASICASSSCPLAAVSAATSAARSASALPPVICSRKPSTAGRTCC